jgi:hypothetical protein
MQTCDQGQIDRLEGKMRILVCLTVSLLGAVLTLSQPRVASAASDQSWQTCVGAATAPADRVSSCTAVIDGKTDSGKRLAAAYCNRGHGLTEKRELRPDLSTAREGLQRLGAR